MFFGKFSAKFIGEFLRKFFGKFAAEFTGEFIAKFIGKFIGKFTGEFIGNASYKLFVQATGLTRSCQLSPEPNRRTEPNLGILQPADWTLQTHAHGASHRLDIPAPQKYHSPDGGPRTPPDLDVNRTEQDARGCSLIGGCHGHAQSPTK